MMPGTPVTLSAKLRRTPCSTPGGSKVREEKILVTVHLRPLNRREQAMYDLIAWTAWMSTLYFSRIRIMSGLQTRTPLIRFLA
ncbi:hypothetical protein ACFX1X_026987 [Malus domestica]